MDDNEDFDGEFVLVEPEAPAWQWSWLAPLCWILHLLEGVLRAFADVAQEAGQDVDAAYNKARFDREFLDEAREEIEAIPVIPNG